MVNLSPGSLEELQGNRKILEKPINSKYLGLKTKQIMISLKNQPVFLFSNTFFGTLISFLRGPSQKCANKVSQKMKKVYKKRKIAILSCQTTKQRINFNFNVKYFPIICDLNICNNMEYKKFLFQNFYYYKNEFEIMMSKNKISFSKKKLCKG